MIQPATEHADADRLQKTQLGALVDSLLLVQPERIAVAHIGDIREHAPAPPEGALYFHLTDPTNPSGTHEFNIRTPEGAAGRRPVLVVYASAGLLSLWDRMEEDVEHFLRGRQQVIIVFLQERFARLTFAGHAYFLSALLSALPGRKFVTSLKVYVAPDADGNAPQAAPAAPPARATTVDPVLMRLLGASSGEGDGYHAPPCFSALAISVTPRDDAQRGRTGLRAKSSVALRGVALLLAAWRRLWLIRAINGGRRLFPGVGNRESSAGR